MPTSIEILVAGDVCLDVVVVPKPAPSSDSDPTQENWRLKGEKRTHFLPGGATLLSEFVTAAVLAAEQRKAQKAEEDDCDADNVTGAERELRVRKAGEKAVAKFQATVNSKVGAPQPVQPPEIVTLRAASAAKSKTRKPATVLLNTKQFIALAERFKRDEVVHSLLEAAEFPKTADPKDKSKVYRVVKEHGYSGPANGDAPSLKIRYPQCPTAPRLVVLADTGNRFRKDTDKNIPWPDIIRQKAKMAKSLVVYKLHHPLPCPFDKSTPKPAGAPVPKDPNPLWTHVKDMHTTNRLVIVSVEDLRSAGAPISRGLSWERSALDIVWQLLNVPNFAELRECPYLIVRLGLDGAVLWTYDKNRKDPDEPHKSKFRAWLVYDPRGIEDAFARSVPGRMVAFSSAFTAALVEQLHSIDGPHFASLLSGPAKYEAAESNIEMLLDFIRAGLRAARKLLELSYSAAEHNSVPHYPGPEMFLSAPKAGDFAHHEIPIIPSTLVPDRGYWRLLDAHFEYKHSKLFAAVRLVATNSVEVKDDPAATDEDKEPKKLLGQVPFAKFGKLVTYDRREIEYYRSLHSLLSDYLAMNSPPRPLSIAVFGPPGAGKSFGVKQVVESLKDAPGCKAVVGHTFNLSLYQSPDELAAAFHLVRDEALRGKVPLVFFDEFDTSLGQQPLGWLRYFLAPMQDGEFLDRGAPHPIGQAIFIFAGGTCTTHEEFSRHPNMTAAAFTAVKGPDFLSRLRAKLDVPGLNFAIAYRPIPTITTSRGAKLATGSPAASAVPVGIETFDPYMPVESFPSDAAVRLRRATVLSSKLERWTGLSRADKSLSINPAVLRTMLELPRFEHGNRSLEALIDMSHLLDATNYTPSQLPADCQCPLHANIEHVNQLIGVEFLFSDTEQVSIAQHIHVHYLLQSATTSAARSKVKSPDKEWRKLTDDYKASNVEQALDIPTKLRLVGLWFRKIPKPPEHPMSSAILTRQQVEFLAHREHDRWVAFMRRKGYVHGKDKNEVLRTHPCIMPWESSELPDSQRRKDRNTIKAIPQFLKAAGYMMVRVE